MNLKFPENLYGLTKSEIKKLYDAAISAIDNAYAPYSKFKVGAAILTQENRVISGCNVENGSFGATICAERVAVVKAVSEGVKSFRAILIVADYENPIPPCGMCRQVINEFSGERIIIMTNSGGDCEIVKFTDVFPHGFIFVNDTDS